MHLLSQAAVSASTLLVCLLSFGSATAYMHPAEGVEVDETAQSAIVMYKNGVQRLYLQPSIRAEGSGDVAWVIPVPSVPEYTIASEAFINWVERALAITKLRKARKARRGDGTLKEHDRLEVGPYRIQAIEARGAEGVEALTQWLESHEFPTGNADHLTYYVDNAWTFVTVRTSVEGSSAEEQTDQLPAIALEFESPAPVVPVRLMANHSEIDVKIWFISDRKLEEDDFRHAHAEFRLNVTSDRRKRSNWGSISDTWVLAQSSVYLSQIRDNAPVIHELKRLYPGSRQLWVYGVAGTVSPKIASAASGEIFFGPADTSLDMTNFEPSAKDPGAPDTTSGVLENEDDQPGLGFDIEKKLKEQTLSGEIDWTTVALATGIFFVIAIFLMVQFMRRR